MRFEFKLTFSTFELWRLSKSFGFKLTFSGFDLVNHSTGFLRRNIWEIGILLNSQSDRDPMFDFSSILEAASY